MAKADAFSIPTIKGQIAQKLARATPRVADADELLEFPPAPAQLTLNDADERGAVALACLILENLRERGGVRIPRRPLETVLRKSLASFGPKEVMDIEVEAYEILLWLGKAIDPHGSRQLQEQQAPLADVSEQSSLDEVIRWAIASDHDLEMDYYSHGRGQFTQRRITPLSLEAETYLHAYCHLRREERVFRLTRIADLRPVGGWPAFYRKRAQQSPDPPPPQGSPPSPQAAPAQQTAEQTTRQKTARQPARQSANPPATQPAPGESLQTSLLGSSEASDANKPTPDNPQMSLLDPK